TVLSSLLARISPAPPWPDLDGTATADSLVLGAFRLTNVSADLHIHASGAEASSFDGGLLGGTIHGTASLQTGDKPVYKLDAASTGLSPAEVGRLATMRWSGGTLDAAGTLQLTGYSEDDLLDSATGSLHFEWGHGAIATATVPPSLAHFDLWSGDASVSHRTMSVKASQVKRGKHTAIVHADVTFAIPARVSFSSGTAPGAHAK
ncbi:MAG TPA: AsmA-like C-terminal region-containing protein, partial [Terracidiphilus sp.]|nr:AsmA-like C-terminal region-containing protein [Terracidiphilus sp.]